LQRALDHYNAIAPNPSEPPFAAFRREHGRAWCFWRMERRPEALRAIRLATQHAGDGGLMRFRIAALGLQAHIHGPGPEGWAALSRAEAMAQRLGDNRLLNRMRHFRNQLGTPSDTPPNAPKPPTEHPPPHPTRQSEHAPNP
ncbi:MAG: hypothetical protein AAFS10_07365, partial [Myxococcota bacterium]